ncbi:MAG: hypothetical protein V3S51_05465 [Dehalococcoidia bacterium]
MTDISIDGDALWFQGYHVGTINPTEVPATVMQEFTDTLNDLNDDKLRECQEAIKEFLRDVGDAPYDELDIETLLTTFGDLIDE